MNRWTATQRGHETMLRSPSFGRRSRGVSVGGALLVAAVFFSLVSAPAQAARRIDGPSNFFCGTYFPATISINPPRIWSSYNRPEQVLWSNQLQRWNGARWLPYSKRFDTYSTFNYYGQSLTSWGRRFVNSKLHLPVANVGYYRVASVIVGNQGGVQWAAHINNGAYCYIS
jgi:hypothetical protein